MSDVEFLRAAAPPTYPDWWGPCPPGVSAEAHEENYQRVLTGRHVAAMTAGYAFGKEHGLIVSTAIDLCWKATPYGQTEDGDVASYILPKGVVHRLVGALQGLGYSASLRSVLGETPDA